MGRRLTGAVPIHTEDGDTVWYLPGQPVPAKHAKLIGAHAWISDDDGDGDQDDDLVLPPLFGRGSGEDAWRAYAAELEVDVTSAKSRDDVVEAIRATGHPVEPAGD